MRLQRKITALGLLFTGIGSIVGSGWLFGPLYAAQNAGPAAILSWIIGGIMMIIIALTFAELGAAFPLAGGMVQYAQFSHGPLVSFMLGWMIWISSVAVAPVETMGLIQYMANYIPGLVTKINNITVLTHFGMSLAAFIMLGMCLLNYQGAAFFSRSSSIISVLKLIVPIITIILLISLNFHATNFIAHTASGTSSFAPYGWHGILTALPLGGVIYSFIGSNTVLQLAGETKNPQRNIPLALIGSVGLCIILYALLQVAFIGALLPHSIQHGWKQLNYVGDSGPFAGIFIALGLAWFVKVLYFDALISPFGTGFIYTTSTARINYGLSKIGFFPQSMQKLTKHGVPIYGLALNYLIGLLLFLPFPAWQNLVSFIISCFIFSYIIGPIALMELRKVRPEHPRPFRLPFANLISLLAFYSCNLLIFWTGWYTVYHMTIALGIGLIVFIFYCYRSKNQLWRQQWRSSWWFVPYLIGLMLISYYGSFGNGKAKINFGWDFALIAILSVIIFYIALNSRQSQTNENRMDYKEIV